MRNPLRRYYGCGDVVMPEHVHLLISEPKTANPSKALQVLKQIVSSALLRHCARLFSQDRV
jgi:REP element-mobilizing transposase RayT